MRMITKRYWNLYDLSTGKKIQDLEPGAYEVERVHSAKYNCHWLVLKGTQLGASEASWRAQKDSSNDYQVIIEPLFFGESP